jgi:glycine/D-amino acid oxidase-like deaminating enzyme
MTDVYAVIGAGPLGSCAARSLAESLEIAGIPAKIYLIDANHPIEQRFDALSAAGPHAAGQLMVHVFDMDSPAKELTRRSHGILKGLGNAGTISLYERPWYCCTGNTGSGLDQAAEEVLHSAYEEGRFEGCTMLRGEDIPATTGLDTTRVAWALHDTTTMAVNPREFVRQLAEHAVEHPLVEHRFDTRVTHIEDGKLQVDGPDGIEDLTVDGIILCTGIHRHLLENALPDSRPEFLHVIDHNEPDHEPEVLHLITGETTIARYAGFGPQRTVITPHLPKAVQEFGIHGLFTDVPGLRRMLDSHFEDESNALNESENVGQLLREIIGRYVPETYLLGDAKSNRDTSKSYVAAYNKLVNSDGPFLEQLQVDTRVVYAQPSNGLGLNQCAALGQDAAALLLLR